MPAAGRRSSRSPTSASTSAPARRSTRRRGKRGNSVYFPDRVVPMLPETLSRRHLLAEGGRGPRGARLPSPGDQGRARSNPGGSAGRGCGSRPISPMRTRRRRSTARSGSRSPPRPARCPRSTPVAVRAGRIDAAAALGLLAGALRGAGEAGAARARPARAAGDARREGADPLGGAARAARRAQADRGLYDRRQCRRGQGAGGEEGAGHVPRPRAAEPREAGRAQGLSEDLRRRIRARPGGAAGDVQPHHRADRRGRFPAADHGADPAHPDPGLLRARKITAISGWRSAPTPISPRRSAAMPT